MARRISTKEQIVVYLTAEELEQIDAIVGRGERSAWIVAVCMQAIAARQHDKETGQGQ